MSLDTSSAEESAASPWLDRVLGRQLGLGQAKQGLDPHLGGRARLAQPGQQLDRLGPLGGVPLRLLSPTRA